MTLPYPHTSDIQGPNLVTTLDGTTQYAVWYTVAGELKVGKRNRATQQWGVNHEEFTITGAARTRLALPVADDEHNYPAITVSGTGHVWVWANMHINELRMIRSNGAGVINSWADALQLPMPNILVHANDPLFPAVTYRWTYPMPIPLPDGKVWFHIRLGNHTSGANESDSYYWFLPANVGNFDNTVPVKMFQGLSVPGAGEGGTVGPDATTAAPENVPNNWSAYPTMPHIENRANGAYRIHISWCWRALPSPSETPSYAYYDSVTGNWHAVDGSTLTLPITPLNNLACQTGLVASPGDTYLNWGGLTVDDNGYPHAIVSNNPAYHQWWNGTSWQQETVPNPLGGVSRTSRCNAYWLRGKLWILAPGVPNTARIPRLWRLDGGGTVAMGSNVGSGMWECHADPEAYRQFGSIEHLVPDGDTPRVYTFGTHAKVRAA